MENGELSLVNSPFSIFLINCQVIYQFLPLTDN